MQNYKIIRLLKCFSAKEVREFGKFVCSPYHNNRKIVIKFYDVLKKYYPDFESVSGEEIYSKVFPGRKFNQGELVRLSSYLFKLGKDYLAISHVKKSGLYYDKHLLESMDEHNADYFFEKEYENAVKKINTGKMDYQFFLSKSMLEIMRIDFKLNRNKQKDICLNVIKNAEYDIFNLIIKLVTRYSDMVVNRTTYNYDFSNTTAELFINNFNFDSFFSNLKIEEKHYYNFLLYYYYKFKTISDTGGKYYNKMREYSFMDFEKLTDEERGNRYIRLFSYCHGQLLRGNLKFLRPFFDFHKMAFDNKLYKGGLSGDFIYPVFFRNFVFFGLAVKEYDYIENFIAQSGSKLKEEYRNDMINLSSALLQFEKKHYAETLVLLNKVRFSFPGCQMDTKSIYIKTYYETDDYDSLFSLIDSFKHFLNRDKTIREVIREQNLKFLNYTNQLAKQKLNVDEGIYDLQKSIKSDMKADPIQKIWLMEKAEELAR